MKPRTLLPMLATLLVFVSGPLKAETQAPEQFLKVLAADAIVLLGSEQLDDVQRRGAFRGLLRRGFDLDRVGRFVLGRHWRQAKEAERQEFLSLFEDYIVATYARRLGGLSNDSLIVTGHRMIGDGTALVDSQVSPSPDLRVNVEWRMTRHGDDWRIVDIMVEGVSLAMTQRAEFGAVIRAGGGELGLLLDKLRQKTAHLREQRVASQVGTNG
jgi:phospholipid transport system substrate-binding protein